VTVHGVRTLRVPRALSWRSSLSPCALSRHVYIRDTSCKQTTLIALHKAITTADRTYTSAYAQQLSLTACTVTVVTFKALRHLIGRLEEVDELLDVVPVVLREPVGERGVVDVVVERVVLKSPVKALNGLLKLKTAE
jgi:hypothetical protein